MRQESPYERSRKPKANDELTAERSKKNPAAVALGRLGGLKGGKARAKKLSAKRRHEIAKKAAAARWGRRSVPGKTGGEAKP